MQDSFIKFIGPEWASQKLLQFQELYRYSPYNIKVRPINGDSSTDKKRAGLCIHLTILARGYNYNAIIRFSTKCYQNQRSVAFHTSEAYNCTYYETSALKTSKYLFTHVYVLQVVYLFSFLISDYILDIISIGHSMKFSYMSF